MLDHVTLTSTAPAMIPSTVDSANGSNDLSERRMKLGLSTNLKQHRTRLRVYLGEIGKWMEGRGQDGMRRDADCQHSLVGGMQVT